MRACCRHQGDLSLRALLSGCVCTVRLWPVSVEVYDKIHVYLRRVIYDLINYATSKKFMQEYMYDGKIKRAPSVFLGPKKRYYTDPRGEDTFEIHLSYEACTHAGFYPKCDMKCQVAANQSLGERRVWGR